MTARFILVYVKGHNNGCNNTYVVQDVKKFIIKHGKCSQWAGLTRALSCPWLETWRESTLSLTLRVALGCGHLGCSSVTVRTVCVDRIRGVRWCLAPAPCWPRFPLADHHWKKLHDRPLWHSLEKEQVSNFSLSVIIIARSRNGRTVFLDLASLSTILYVQKNVQCIFRLAHDMSAPSPLSLMLILSILSSPHLATYLSNWRPLWSHLNGHLLSLVCVVTKYSNGIDVGDLLPCIRHIKRPQGGSCLLSFCLTSW